ncbi:pro-neuregulin-2, membrane-bound isoform isoform X2 [Phacochoerus africanus]|uniref:pro-neuregulin-2, membrane-bound isoform isoform X2 n=1 Tax=Phacochoerus africanus TaxID=41426 RepID=UPI001FDA4B65|nr:pro-neuregulin-2, membrane-bound isoform isoform X2 [Phacochoerus africanus]
MRQVCCSALPPPPLEKARCSSYSDSSSSSSSSSSSERSSSSSSSSESSSSRSSSSRSSSSSISRPAAPPEPRPQPQPQPRSPAARRAAARSRAAAAGGMRRDPAPGFSMLLFGVSLACYSPSLKSVQDQAYKAPVVVEGKVQGLAPAGGSSSNSTREPPASGRVALVKVLDKWPLRSGGLQREQVISVGSCAPLERNQRYIFFLEPTEQPFVFKTAFAPLDTNGKNLKKEVGKILCTDCATRPKLKKMKSQTGQVGEKQSLKCEAAAGNPQPSYRWFKDGKELNRSRDIRIKYGNGRKNSRLQFNKVKVEDAGEYVCEAENILGKDTARGRLFVNSVSTTLSSWSGHARKCNETAKSYCVNGGVCYYIEGINQLSCKCPVGYTGDRCQQFAMVNFSKAEELYQKRVLTITGICVALLVVGIVCVVAYCKTKKQRKQMHNHLRQNMCPAHQNRSLANGPSHPRLDPEEIQMADYISKNVPATDHVIRRETETTFSGSHSCSPSHHCSTATPTSSHRHESHTWSLERSESLTSDSQSGIMLSSVGTSKCNSPACVEARARRAAAYSLEERRRAVGPPHHDSTDSLRDSPHSERYVSALTTPARLSPVDFHYSLATQVPTFEITSPNSAHAVSLPPAAPSSYRLAEQQPLLRHPAPVGPDAGPGPGADMQRSYDSYYYPAAGPGPRRGACALGGSLGSLPASPFRIPEDDEYETTQECVPPPPPPPPPPPRPRARGASRRTSAGPRRWRRSRLNGLAAQRARAARDSLSLSSGSGGGSASASDDDADDADGSLAAESTPFLGLRAAHDALRSDSPPLCPAADSRTYYSLDSHSTRASSRHSRGPPPRAKQDSAPL